MTATAIPLAFVRLMILLTSASMAAPPGIVCDAAAKGKQKTGASSVQSETTRVALPAMVGNRMRVDYHIDIKTSPPARHNREMPDAKLTAIDSNALPWEERPNEKIGRSLYRKNLIEDPDTGMEVRLVRYPAGAVNPLHTHPCAHGMYVLEGTLVTHQGQYGPGHFVWFPEGSVMEHGATADEDVTVLFITNKPFEIHYR
jgi:quercetin dioxygenase-like cupin family protein